MQTEDQNCFSRDGDDLIYFYKLSLAEAMSPCSFSIKTLDGRTVAVSPGEYVTSQTVICIEGEGMPIAAKDEYVVDA